MQAAHLPTARLNADGGEAPATGGDNPATGGDAPARGPAGQVAAFAGWAAGAFVLTGVGVAGLLALVGNADWWRGLLAATIVSLLAAVFSAVPVALSLGRGQLPMVIAFFVAMGLRAGITLGGGLLAVSAGDWPRVPTLLLCMPYYFALIAVESAVLGRALWQTDTKLNKTDAQA